MRPTFSPSAASRPSTDCRCARPTRIFHTCITTQQEMVRECAACKVIYKSPFYITTLFTFQYVGTAIFVRPLLATRNTPDKHLCLCKNHHHQKKIALKNMNNRSQKLFIIGSNFFQYCQSAQNQPKSHFLLHKNVSFCNVSITTLG